MEKSSPETAPKLTIKKESLNDDIKEFAETAMNELLGWYGYDNNSHGNARGCISHSGSNSSEAESPKTNEGCGWCGKPVDETTALSSAAAIFCSELCFSQSRRANFKKNKTCDWCRHVRHTVSYVDSQDGLSQLQFCSDKCLNQYKMQIFWRETRAHLEVHPHVHAEESSGTLITPDLWMNKCKSPERENNVQSSPLPLITVAHPSKLMPVPVKEVDKRQRAKLQKRSKRKSVNTQISNEMPQDLRVRHSPEIRVSNTEPSTETTEQKQNSNTKPLDGLLPPPMVLVPYPLILPLPIPIPIPIPLQIPTNTKDEKKYTEESSQTEDQTIQEPIRNQSRLLRKRKRIMDRKVKFNNKNKKIISA